MDTPPRPRVTVMVPAHNAAGEIEATLARLRAQTLPPDRVIVIAESCSDNTAEIASAAGAEVYETQEDHAKKAGSVNRTWTLRFRRVDERRGPDLRTGDRRQGPRGWTRPRPSRYRGPERRAANRREGARRVGTERRVSAYRLDLAPQDRVLVLDVNTVLAPRFLEAAAAALDLDDGLGAAGGSPGAALLDQARRDSAGSTRPDNVMVVRSTGTLFRAEALRRVAAARGTLLPGEPGQLYDTAARTDDDELTRALKTLGYRVTSPPACDVGAGRTVHSTTLAVIVPAHNEEEQIADTIQSLLRQTVLPDRIIIVADNCTDRTVEIARMYPVTVMETVDNPHKKSGALNQAWQAHCQDVDYVATMDADTVLADDFFELALGFLNEPKNWDIGGACACPMLKPEPPGLSAWKQMIWSLGKLDFGGYMRILCRWKMRPEVLFGYGTILRNQALLNVADLYENGPWDTSSIVEDYRLSLDLRWMRYRLAIIPGALAFTDVPVTIRGSQGLWRQRIRWAAGTWQEIAREGWHVRTAKVWGTVLGCLVAAMLRLLTVALWITAAALHLGFAWSWWWSIPLLVSTLDRFDMTRYTKDANWKDVVVAISLLPLEFIGVLREAWTIRSAWLVTRKKRLSW